MPGNAPTTKITTLPIVQRKPGVIARTIEPVTTKNRTETNTNAIANTDFTPVTRNDEGALLKEQRNEDRRSPTRSYKRLAFS